MRALVVGDVHVKTSNIALIQQLNKWICSLVVSESPDVVILLGDILDYHEKVLIPCLNTAYDMIRSIAELVPVYVLVGNHDYISNMQFMTDCHWMNAMKAWTNVMIVDKAIMREMNGETVVLCPYLPPGRFNDALATLDGASRADVIFCHQEFRGADLGVVKSIVGDVYDLGALCVSGHIHDNQTIGRVYYVGAPLQHAFGEKDKRVVCIVDNKAVREISVPFGRKKSVLLAFDEASAFKPEPGTDTRVILSGTVSECKAFKKTSKFKELCKHAKVVFRTEAYVATKDGDARKTFASTCKEHIGANDALLDLFQSLL